MHFILNAFDQAYVCLIEFHLKCNQSKEKDYKHYYTIGIPAIDAFKQFVRMSYNQTNNKTQIMGFSINVFEKVVKHLPYQLN